MELGMKLLNSIDKMVEEKFETTNISNRLENLIKNATTQSNNDVINFDKRIFEIIELINNSSSAIIYEREYFRYFLKHKNRLIEKTANPLYSIYRNKTSEEEFINDICYFLLKEENVEGLELALKRLEFDLSDIMTSITILQRPELYKSMMPSAAKKDITTYEELEIEYFNTLFQENQELKDNYFNDDDIYKSYVFNLNVVAMAELYRYVKSKEVLESHVNLGKFLAYFYPVNDFVLEINFKNSTLTEKDFGFLLKKLEHYFKPPKKFEYINYLNKKVKIISKHDNQNLIDDAYYKNNIRPYKNDPEKLNDSMKEIHFMFENIKMLAKQN